jgi:hypothetical protein
MAASSEFSRIIHVANSVWVLSWLDSRTFGKARQRPQLHLGGSPPDPKIRYGDFLNFVLAPGLAGDCWIRQQPCPSSGHAPWKSQDDDAQALVSEVTQQVDATWRKAWDGDSDNLDIDLGLRMFLTADRFQELWGSALLPESRANQLDYYALLDFRFFVRLNQLRCHVSTSIWSALPRDAEHCPPPFLNNRDTELMAEVDAYRKLFEDLTSAFERELKEFFTWDGFDIQGRRFGLPAFWIVVPSRDQIPTEPHEHLRRTGPTTPLFDLFLGRDAHDQTVACSVTGGGLLVTRRMIRTEEVAQPSLSSNLIIKETPAYLILPATAQVGDPHERAHVEVATAKVITDLTDLEVHAEHQLYEVQADLEIWCNHLTMYDAVVERGAFLWDALSTHLPIRKGTSLAKTHRIVALAHQVLLQALADLAHIGALIRRCEADVASTVEELEGSYDERISELRTSSDVGLRSALVKSGRVERIAQLSVETRAKAGRVKTAYKDQLSAIAHAFDERRAREFDTLQKGMFTLSAAAARSRNRYHSGLHYATEG